jgi:hypothetical protein
MYDVNNKVSLGSIFPMKAQRNFLARGHSPKIKKEARRAEGTGNLA